MSRQKKIIDSFASGNQSEDTRNLFSQWLLSPQDKELKEQALDDLWESADASSGSTEKALLSTRKRIFGTHEGRPRRRQSFVRWALAMSVVIPIAVIVFSALYVHNVKTGAAEWNQTVVPCGERGYLTLADGTELWLGAGTRVIYPAKFTGSERQIFVDGEVYAEIAHDPKHPFVMTLSDADVRVLGTTFALNAYSNDDEVEIMLVEGGVSFDIYSSTYEGNIVMSPNDIVSFTRSSGEVVHKNFQYGNYHSWARDGSMNFFDEPLCDIATQLSRRFNRQIVIADHDLLSTRFDVFLTNDKSLDDVLNIFQMNKSIGVEERDDIIYLFKR